MVLGKHSILAVWLGSKRARRARSSMTRAWMFMGVVLAATSAAAAQGIDPAECTVGDLTRLMKAEESSQVSRPEPRTMVETVSVREKLYSYSVQVRQGGCAHYGVVISFYTAKDTPPHTAALRVIKTLKAKAARPDVFEQMRVLLQRHGAKTKLGEPIQDRDFEMATLYLESVRHRKDQQHITVTLSIAL